MSLPLFHTDDKNLQLLQNTWSQQLNPLLAFPPSKGLLLKSVSLSTGNNTVNHRLGRTLQGWSIVRMRSAARVYDEQDNNPSPQLTLILVSSADVVVDLWVF